MPKVPSPTDAQVDEYHARYVAALRKLYDAHKDTYCAPTDFDGKPLPVPPLRIVE